MSEKKIRGTKEQLKFIFEKLHEGMRQVDYRCAKSEEEIIHHSTLNDHLKFLEETGIAYVDKKDGKWYYTWKKKEEELREEYQEYKNIVEYNIKLKHSKTLLKPALGNADKSDFDENKINVYKIMCNQNFNYLLQHLKTGYPKIYKSWLDIKKELSSLGKSFWSIYSDLEEIAIKEGFNPDLAVLPSTDLPYEGGERLDASIQTFIGIYCSNSEILLDLERFKSHFFPGVKFKYAPSPERMDTYIAFFPNYFFEHDITPHVLDKLAIVLRPILIRVLEGEPLRGKCGRCPKVTIGR